MRPFLCKLFSLKSYYFSLAVFLYMLTEFVHTLSSFPLHHLLLFFPLFSQKLNPKFSFISPHFPFSTAKFLYWFAGFLTHSSFFRENPPSTPNSWICSFPFSEIFCFTVRFFLCHEFFSLMVFLISTLLGINFIHFSFFSSIHFMLSCDIVKGIRAVAWNLEE